jgi:hypothetical protein
MMQIVGFTYGVNAVWSALKIKAVLIAGHADGIGAASLHLYIRQLERKSVLFFAIRNF